MQLDKNTWKYLTNYEQMHSPELTWLVANKTKDSKTIKHSQYRDEDVL